MLINAKYVRFTGTKWEDKVYDKYSGYPSGRKEANLKGLMEKNPSRILYLSIKGMLPKNSLRKRMLRSLKIYPDDKYSQVAQNPKKIEV